MSEEYQESQAIRFDEMMAADVEDTTPGSVFVKTGTVAGDINRFTRKSGVSPNAVRWVFNPYRVIYLANDAAAFCVPYLENIKFNKIESIPTKVRANSPFDLAFSPLDGISKDEDYQHIDRTVFQQVSDITDRHSDEGVIVIEALMNASDEDAEGLNTLLFGEGLACTIDPHNPDYPCPVLPNLLETLELNVRSSVQDLDAETRQIVLQTAEQIRKAIGVAITNARKRIDAGQIRLLDEKSPNRFLNNEEQRCYLALGQEIPNVMPFITRKAADAMNAGQGIDEAKLGAAISAGVVAGMRTVKSVEKEQNREKMNKVRSARKPKTAVAA